MMLRFTPRSLADIEAIADYIKARNPTAAVRDVPGNDELMV